MKYDERTCKVNMDTGCVELRLRDGRMISIDCTGVEDELDVTMAQRTELDYLILQNPMTCFDPLYRIGQQIAETFSAHNNWTAEEIHVRSLELLEKMRIRNPEEVLEKYPHQLSGGMLQRIMIGIATAMKPALLIADEPTTAIDAITQYEILNELLHIKENHNTAMIFIDCTGVEDALDVTMAQRSELDYLIYNDPLGYADLILNGDPEKYLKNVNGSHGLED